VVAPDLLLLDSKLSVPRPRPGFVSRAGLIEKAREGGCRVIGVTAPAGYGKSTLLVEWALAEDRPVVWVSFDRLHARGHLTMWTPVPWWAGDPVQPTRGCDWTATVRAESLLPASLGTAVPRACGASRSVSWKAG
jgi:hypothetical protein